MLKNGAGKVRRDRQHFMPNQANQPRQEFGPLRSAKSSPDASVQRRFFAGCEVTLPPFVAAFGDGVSPADLATSSLAAA